jgi:hypothetical protein
MATRIYTRFIHKKFGRQYYILGDKSYVIGYDNKKDDELSFPISPCFKSKRIPMYEILPLYNTTVYSIPELMKLKSKLIDAKNELELARVRYSGINNATERPEGKLPSYGVVDKISYAMNIYKPLRKEIAIRYNAQKVSNAWMKLHEMIVSMDIVPQYVPDGHEYKVFCNAEFPGSFVFYINHYMKTMRPNIKFSYVASSLVDPSNNNKFYDDYGLYEMNPDNWLMKKDPMNECDEHSNTAWLNDGDVTKVSNILDFESRLKGSIDLYLSDAGIDVSSDYSNQEILNKYIDMGQILIGLLTLKIGGSFITKQYTFFESFNVSMITILSTCFEELHICKPPSSTPTNSEIYIVGKKYKGMLGSLREKLLERMNGNIPIEIPIMSYDAIPIDTLDGIIKCARYMYEMQILYLNKYVEYINRYNKNPKILSSLLRPLKDIMREKYLEQYKIGVLQDADKIPCK